MERPFDWFIIPWKYGFKSAKSMVKIRFSKGSARRQTPHNLHRIE